jgi:hypothetical protein
MRLLFVGSLMVNVVALVVLVVALRRRTPPAPRVGADSPGQAVPSPIAEEKTERIELERLPAPPCVQP